MDEVVEAAAEAAARSARSCAHRYAAQGAGNQKQQRGGEALTRTAFSLRLALLSPSFPNV